MELFGISLGLECHQRNYCDIKGAVNKKVCEFLVYAVTELTVMLPSNNYFVCRPLDGYFGIPKTLSVF